MQSDGKQEASSESILHCQSAPTIEQHYWWNPVLSYNPLIHSASGLGEISVLVKKGDDLRKDQLIMGIMRILSRLLEEDGFKSYFQCYSCLSTSNDEGLIEIVPNSVTIGDVYNDTNSIVSLMANEETSKHRCRG